MGSLLGLSHNAQVSIPNDCRSPTKSFETMKGTKCIWNHKEKVQGLQEWDNQHVGKNGNKCSFVEVKPIERKMGGQQQDCNPLHDLFNIPSHTMIAFFKLFRQFFKVFYDLQLSSIKRMQLNNAHITYLQQRQCVIYTANSVSAAS